MPKLLMVSTIPRFLDDFLLPFARHFRGKGWRVDALTGPGAERARASAEFDRVWTVDWSRHPLAIVKLQKLLRRIRQLLAREHYDIVHVHTPIAAFVTRLALRSSSAHRPVLIYTAHGFHFHPHGNPFVNAVYVGLEKLAGRWTDYLVVMNQHDAEAAERYRLVDASRLRRMPGIGLDLRAYNRDATTIEQRGSLQQEVKVNGRFLLMVAEFNPGKRHSDLLQAFAQVARRPEADDLHLVFAGQGKLMDACKKQARDLGIESRTHFLGQRNDVPALLAQALALILPSEREGLPRCVLEAMSMGTPVIATRIRGNSELLDGGVGRLFAVGDVGELAAEILTVTTKPDIANGMSVAGRSRALAYSLDIVIELHEALYAEALDGTAQAKAGLGAARAAR